VEWIDSADGPALFSQPGLLGASSESLWDKHRFCDVTGGSESLWDIHVEQSSQFKRQELMKREEVLRIRCLLSTTTPQSTPRKDVGVAETEMQG
jgi:hypothetical protein